MSAQQSNQDVNVVGIPPSGTHTTNVVPQTEANQRPSDSETASHPNIAGATKISSSETGTEPSGETGSGSPGLDTTQDSYPEQRHAGAVGYGPSYNKGVVSFIIPQSAQRVQCILRSNLIFILGGGRENRRHKRDYCGESEEGSRTRRAWTTAQDRRVEETGRG